MLGDHIGVSLTGWVFTIGKHPRHNEDWDSIRVPEKKKSKQSAIL